MTPPIPNKPAALDPATLTEMLRATLASLPVDPAASAESTATRREAVVIALTALRPRDPMQAMLAARIVASHHAAMECFRLAARPGIADSVALRLHGKAISLANMATRTLRELQRCQAAPPAHEATEQPAGPHPAETDHPAQPAGELTRASREPDVVTTSDPTPAATAPEAAPDIAIQDTPADAERSRFLNDRIGSEPPYAPEPAALAA